MHVDDLVSYEDYVINQRGMVENEVYTLSAGEIDQIEQKYGANPPEPEEFLPESVDPLNAKYSLGIRDPMTQVPAPDLTVNARTTFNEMYTSQFAAFDFPLRNLQRNTCVGQCDIGYTAVNGVCLECNSPCYECRNSVTRCVNCRQDQPNKYHYGTLCYAQCPIRTIPDEANMRCLGCIDGCDVCDAED